MKTRGFARPRSPPDSGVNSPSWVICPTTTISTLQRAVARDVMTAYHSHLTTLPYHVRRTLDVWLYMYTT